MNSATYPVTQPTSGGMPVLDRSGDDSTRRLEQVIREHAVELTIRRKQPTAIMRGGAPDDSSWRKEVDFFIEQIVDPKAGMTKSSAERDTQVRRMIEAATAHYSSSRVCFPLERDLPFEHLVADALAELGWNTCFVNGEGERGSM